MATGEAFSVVPRTIRDVLDLEIKPVPGWKGSSLAWFGVACGIGRISIWLPIEENPGELRQFSMLALLPDADVPDTPPFVQLGMQFFVENGAQIQLDCGMSKSGRLTIP